ncbi:MAG: protein kinase, partial [Oscillospiraceae bacterium]|nr:protein kinase [Oscillospiraceae bacterium]
MSYLKKGEIVTTENGGQFTVVVAKPDKKKIPLGEGGQGVAYKVESGGKFYALKWYKPKMFSDDDRKEKFRENLAKNIRDEAPSGKFVWPLQLTKYKEGTFGYIMELFPSAYTSMSDIMIKPDEARFTGDRDKGITPLEAEVNAALNIINAFRDLHRAGKSYQDVNEGGFYIRLSDGDVLICDCDNVAEYEKNLGIIGKPGYMAPEIVASIGQSRDNPDAKGKIVLPSVSTDDYSMANILFRLLFRGDPLAGARDCAAVCLTEKAEREIYGDNPIFVYDPDNDKNRPVRGVHDNIIGLWPGYPPYIREAFTHAFTKAAKNPNLRKSANEWLKLFVRLKGDLIRCKCGFERFTDIFKKADGKLVCPKCGQKYPMPMQISPNGLSVTLFPRAKLLAGHTDNKTGDLSSEDYMKPTGLVVANPNDPNRWGIRNMSTSIRSVKPPNSEWREL